MAPIAYLNFDLQIERMAQGYSVEVESPTGQATHTFSLPFSDLELENFVLRLGHTRRGMRRIDSPEVEAAKTFGARLFDAVFDDEVRACLRSSLDEASRQGDGLRIRLRLNHVPELADLPWEYLYNPALNRFLTLSAKTPIVRYLELPERIRPLAITPPLRVLALISSPRDYPLLDVEREWSKLRTALGDLEQRGLVVVERLEQASLLALQQRLRRGTCNILHFIGHGGFDQQQQDGVLLLEDEDGHGYRVSGQDLGAMLYDHDPLRLAVLNACEGGRASRTDPFAGVAQSLVQQGTPAVIAMQFEVTDEAAISMSQEFYGAIADGYPVDAALAEARRALFAQGYGVEWGTPVLYMRALDGKIFDVAPVTSTAPAQREPAPQAAPAPPQVGTRDTDGSPDSADVRGNKVAPKATSLGMGRSGLGCRLNLVVQVAMMVLLFIGGGFGALGLIRSLGGDTTTGSFPTAGGVSTATPSSEALATPEVTGSVPADTASAGGVRPPEAAPPAGPSVVAQAQCRVLVDALSLRAGPGTFYDPPIRALSRDTLLTPLARNENGSWIRVQVQADGNTGWVSANEQYISCNIAVAQLPEAEIAPTPTTMPMPTALPTPAVTLAPVPRNDIRNFQVIMDTTTELRLKVDYTYTGDHGTGNIFMSTYALQHDGSQVPGTGYSPSAVSVGEGSATVSIKLISGSGTYTSTTVKVCLYVGRGAQFSCKSFAYTRSWHTAQLPAPVQLSPANGTVFSNFPRTTRLEWSAVRGAASYTVEIEFCPPTGCASNMVQLSLKPNLAATNYTFDFVGAQPGRWRVWAVDAAGQEGLKSGWWEFRYTL